jgi:hypothetical protein
MVRIFYVHTGGYFIISVQLVNAVVLLIAKGISLYCIHNQRTSRISSNNLIYFVFYFINSKIENR